VASKAGSVKAIPWRLVLEVATVVVNRFRDDVPPGDRQRLTKLVRKSKGDPRRLTPGERSELLTILKRVDVQRLGRDVTGLIGARKLRQRLGRS
jgi:hypothetical protein